MPQDDAVSVSITIDSVGLARAGFGTPFILSWYAPFTARTTRTYSQLSDVALDFAASTPEYLAAQAIFSQNPHPETIKIGAALNKPTMWYSLNVASVKNSTAYVVNVVGEGFTSAVATFTSDATATNDEIAAGLVTALNAVASKNYTATTAGSAGSLTVLVTASAAGEWFSLEVVDVSLLGSKQTHADPGVAADLTAIAIVDSDWYGLITFGNSNACVLAAAAWVEANEKIYIAETSETDGINQSVGFSDTADDLRTLNYARSAPAYHPAANQMFAAAWYGKVFPYDPGSETWKFKNLAGVAAVVLNSTQLVNLRARKANSYYTRSGRATTFDGTTADGGYIDTRRGLDFAIDDLRTSLAAMFYGAPKIPYDDSGVATAENVIRGSLGRSTTAGVFRSNPAFTISVPKVANISDANKAARILPDMKFTAQLAGAVHKIIVRGVVSL